MALRLAVLVVAMLGAHAAESSLHSSADRAASALSSAMATTAKMNAVMRVVDKVQAEASSNLANALAAGGVDELEKVKKCQRLDTVAKNMKEVYEETFAKLSARVSTLRLESDAASSLLQAQEKQNTGFLESASIQELAKTNETQLENLISAYMDHSEKQADEAQLEFPELKAIEDPDHFFGPATHKGQTAGAEIILSTRLGGKGPFLSNAATAPLVPSFGSSLVEKAKDEKPEAERPERRRFSGWQEYVAEKN